MDEGMFGWVKGRGKGDGKGSTVLNRLIKKTIDN